MEDLNASDLRLLCDKIGKDWKKLGRELGLSEEELIDLEFKTRLYDLYEASYQTLLTWQRKFGFEARIETTMEAVIAIGRGDIIREHFPDYVKTQHVHNDEIAEPGNDVLVISKAVLATSIQKIQALQRLCYQTIQLPKVQWQENKIWPLEELYVDLILDTSPSFLTERKNADCFPLSQEGNVNKEEKIDITQIFDTNNGWKPTRILIEGKPGYGKTTLACKIAFDWAKNEEYLTSKFKLMFIISLRYFSGSLEDVLLEECSVQGMSDEFKRQVISHCEQEILLILDGFDEMSSSAKQSLLPLLKGEDYPSMTVLLTCRQGEFQLDKDASAASICGFIKRRNERLTNVFFWMKHIEILGVSELNQPLFMKKYLSEANYSKFSRINCHQMQDFCKCPMFLLLLAVLVEEEELSSTLTKTQLYKKFFNLIIKRSLARENSFDSVDLFKKRGKRNPYFGILDRFGKVALNKLKTNQLLLNEADILQISNDSANTFLQLGLVCKLRIFQKHEKFDVYEVFHKSFFEFAAAFHLTNLVKSNSRKTRKFVHSEIVWFMEHKIYPKKEQLFYLFLGGLLEEKASVLFESLLPWAAFNFVTSVPMFSILLEMQYLPSLVASLIPFIPSCWTIHYSNKEFAVSQWHQPLLKQGLVSGKIRTIICNMEIKFWFPERFQAKTLVLYVTAKDVSNGIRSLMNSTLYCDHLYYFINDYSEGNWEIMANLITKVKMGKFSIKLNGCYCQESIMSRLHCEMTQGKWKGFTLWKLKIFGLCVETDVEGFRFLEHLVRSCKIERELCIWIGLLKSFGCTTAESLSTIHVQSLLSAVKNSKMISEFNMINYVDDIQLSIDFQTTGRPSNKRWSYIYLDGNVRLRSPDDSTIDVATVEFGRRDDFLTDDASFLLRSRNLLKMMCFDNLSQELGDRLPIDWPGYTSVNEFHISLTNAKSDNLIFLPNFKNLRFLTIDLYYLRTVSSEENAEQLAAKLRCLSLKFLKIKGVATMNLPYLENLIKGLFLFSRDQESSTKGLLNVLIPESTTNTFTIQEFSISFCNSCDRFEVINVFSVIRYLLEDSHIRKFLLVHPSFQQELAFLDSFSPQDKFRFTLENDDFHSGTILSRSETTSFFSVRKVIGLTKDSTTNVVVNSYKFY